MEEVEDKLHDRVGEVGVVAEALVAEEGVGSVDFDPAHAGPYLVELGLDHRPALEGDVRVLAAPDHEELSLDISGAGEGVVVHAGSERGLVEVGGVEADGAEDLGVEGGAEGEVAADADTHATDFAVAVGAGEEVVDDGAGVSVVAGELLFGLKGVASVGAGLVVGEDLSGRDELVIDLGDGYDVTVAGEHGGGAADGGGCLEDLGVEKDGGVAAGGRGAQDVGAHGAVRGGELYVFAVDDDHADIIGPYWQRQKIAGKRRKNREKEAKTKEVLLCRWVLYLGSE